MKIPYIQITFLLIAVVLAFTPEWKWAIAIIFWLIVYRTNKPARYENSLDKFI